MDQADLFTPSLLNVDFAVKDAMNQAAKNCSLSREQIVDKMNNLASGYQIRLNQGNAKSLTTAMLEKWLSREDPRRIGYHALVVFCKVTGSLEPISALAAPLCGRVISGEQIMRLEWAEAQIDLKKAKKRAKQLDDEVMK